MIAERHKFWTASQGEHETISDFVVSFKKLACTCNFDTLFFSGPSRRAGVSDCIRKRPEHTAATVVYGVIELKLKAAIGVLLMKWFLKRIRSSATCRDIKWLKRP